jgi:hypothetical protein
LGDGYEFAVADAAGEAKALRAGGRALPPAQPDAPEYPKMMHAALVEKFASVLKQAAIEEGQWTEKRETSGGVSLSVLEAWLNAGRDRVAALKRAENAKAAALAS